MSLAVILPVRKDQGLSPLERVSLNTLNEHLSEFRRILLFPSRNPPTYEFEGWEKLAFPDCFFGTAVNYSKQLLSPLFYNLAEGYEWLLVVHLDVLILGSIKPWLSKREDYWGAPWFHAGDDGKLVSTHAGNGGVSLRRTASFSRVLNSRPPLKLSLRDDGTPRPLALRLLCFFSRLAGLRWHHVAPFFPKIGVHEDTFWARMGPILDESYATASVADAVFFAWETELKKCFEMTGGTLPFGIHAWWNYDPEFLLTLVNTKLRDQMQEALQEK